MQNDFLKMLLTLVDAKLSQGLLNVDFKFENLTDLISPHKIIEAPKKEEITALVTLDDNIWYAIFQNVAFEAGGKTKLTRQRFKGNKEAVNTDVHSMESLTRIPDVLKDFRVQCFFSFASHEKNTFNAMTTEGIEKYIDKSLPLTAKLRFESQNNHKTV